MKKTYFLAAIFLLAIGGWIVSRDKPSPPTGCVFCNEEIVKNQKCYEDDFVLVLYTHQPILPAHFLIIPKRHSERFEMLSEEEMIHITQAINKVRKAVEKEFGITAYLLHQKNGREVGQSVPHVHFHFIARPSGDTSLFKLLIKVLIAHWKGPIERKEMNEVIEKMRTVLQ